MNRATVLLALWHKRRAQLQALRQIHRAAWAARNDQRAGRVGGVCRRTEARWRLIDDLLYWIYRVCPLEASDAA